MKTDCKGIVAIVESIVHEFYVRIPNTVDNMVKARDLLISFGLYNVNAYYCLVDIG